MGKFSNTHSSRILFTLIIIIPIFSVPALAAVDTASPWHPLQQIAISEADTIGIDEDGNKIVDKTETLALTLDGGINKASIGIGSTGSVLKIIGNPASVSAIDFYSGTANAWGIGRGSSGSFYIDKSGDSNVLTINPLKNVGIGTTSPNNKLEVAGKIFATGDVCTSMGGGNCLSSVISDDGDWVVSGNDIYSAKTGYVGILTQTPGSELHIRADSQYSGNADLELESFDGATKWTLSSENAGVFSIYDKTNNKFPFRIQKNAPSASVYITNLGNIGIGTNTPSKKLDVLGGIRATQDICTDANGGKCLGSSALDDNDWTVSESDMYSAVSGKVGIGTNSPGAKLDVIGKVKVSNDLILGDGLVTIKADGSASPGLKASDSEKLGGVTLQQIVDGLMVVKEAAVGLASGSGSHGAAEQSDCAYSGATSAPVSTSNPLDADVQNFKLDYATISISSSFPWPGNSPCAKVTMSVDNGPEEIICSFNPYCFAGKCSNTPKTCILDRWHTSGKAVIRFYVDGTYEWASNAGASGSYQLIGDKLNKALFLPNP